MAIGRRKFFRQMTVGAVVSAGTLRLNGLSQAAPSNQSDSTSPSGPMRLDMNVNPYGPSPRAIDAIRANFGRLNQYPDAEYGRFREQIASIHNVKPEQVTLGSGSTEILRMAVATYLSGGKRFILASPTFDPITHLAREAGAEVVGVPIDKTFAHDLDRMLRQTNASTGLVYICNPNNPTGSLTPRKDLEVFLQKLPSSTVVIIDEAYHDYVGETSDYASFTDQADDQRLIVVRTFSKIHGLAGLRIGYAVSSAEVSRRLSLSHQKWNVSVAAVRAAAAALDDSEYVRLSAKRNADDRQEFYNQINARMQRQIDSHTNFVFMRADLPSSQIIKHFAENNILLGPPVAQMNVYVRVSIGTREEMREFWRVWGLLPMSHEMATSSPLSRSSLSK
jgi:histidinol-phosphate aminotransferase